MPFPPETRDRPIRRTASADQAGYQSPNSSVVGTVESTGFGGAALATEDTLDEILAAVAARSVDDEFWVRHAINETAEAYGDTVSVEAKKKTLHKFGENLLVGTTEATIMTMPAGTLAETYVSTNAITHVSSSNAGDTQQVGLEGHTISGSDLTFVTQNATLNGQTKVALATPLARLTRLYNRGSTVLAGDVYGFEDDTLTAGVPDTDSKVHMIVHASEQQSLKASTAVSAVDYMFITSLYASVNKKTAALVVVRMKVRTSGGVFRTLFKRGVSNTGPDLIMEFRPFVIVPKNSDIILTAEADAASTPVSGGFNSLLALVQ